MPRKANPNRPEYAQIIASAREEKGISQELFGHLIGRDAASVKKYEYCRQRTPLSGLTQH